MSGFWVRFFIAFVLLLPLQALIFNHMILFNVAVPFVFIYLIIMLPVTIGTNLSTTIGFITGLVMDMFCDTQGLYAMCCTIISFVRKPVFHLYVSMDDDLAGREPSAKTMGVAAFMKYIVSLSLIFCLCVFVIETFQFTRPGLLIPRIISSTCYTFVFIYTLDSLFMRRNEKRL